MPSTAIKCPHCGDYLTIAVTGARPSLLLRLSARLRGWWVKATGTEDRREKETPHDIPEPVQAGPAAP
jgi:hypothetical protein